MIKILTKQIILISFLLFSFNALSQKYGHLNSGNIIEIYPDVANSDIVLEKYQKELIDAFTVKMEAFEVAYNDLNKLVQGGTLSPKAQQEEEAKLKVMQEEIVRLERENDQKIRDKRIELLKPILDKVNEAIQEVGKENGFTMIFDTAVFNAILYVDEAVDVSSLVRAKLGI